MEKNKEHKESALIRNWQEKASRRRADDAWRAGVSTTHEYDNYPNLQEVAKKSRRNSDELEVASNRGSPRPSMRASQLRTSDENVVLAYHPPITTVRFQCSSQEGETRIEFSKKSEK